MHFIEWLNKIELLEAFDLAPGKIPNMQFNCKNGKCTTEFVVDNKFGASEKYTVFFEHIDQMSVPVPIPIKQKLNLTKHHFIIPSDNIWQIDFASESMGYEATGESKNPAEIYAKVFYAIQEFDRQKNMDGLVFSGHSGNMDLLYERFYKKFMSSTTTRISHDCFLKNSFVEKMNREDQMLVGELAKYTQQKWGKKKAFLKQTRELDREQRVSQRSIVGHPFIWKSGDNFYLVIVLEVSNRGYQLLVFDSKSNRIDIMWWSIDKELVFRPISAEKINDYPDRVMQGFDMMVKKYPFIMTDPIFAPTRKWIEYTREINSENFKKSI